MKKNLLVLAMAFFAHPVISVGSQAPASDQIIIEYFNRDQPDLVPYEKCVSIRRPDHMIKSIEVPTLAACYTYQDENCGVPLVSQFLPVVPKIKTLNVGDLDTGLFGSFICEDFQKSIPGQHLQNPAMFGRLEHVGMGLNPPKPKGTTVG